MVNRSIIDSMTTTSNNGISCSNNHKKIHLNYNEKEEEEEVNETVRKETNHHWVGVTALHPTILAENIPYILLCIAILHGVYLYCSHIYDTTSTKDDPTTIIWLLEGVLQVPSVDDCRRMIAKMNHPDLTTENDKCGRPDLFAFQMVSGLVFIIVSALGLHAWYHHTTIVLPSSTMTSSTTTHSNRPKKRYILSTPELRLYGYQYESHIILILNLSYQIWDFYVSLYMIPEYCTTIMLCHHGIAAFVAFYALYNHMFSYYVIFFVGLSEVSSIFLVSLDLHKYFIPLTTATTIATATIASASTTDIVPIRLLLSKLFFFYSQHMAGPCFLITFLYYRIVLWYRVSRQLWIDVHDVTTTTTTTTSTTGGSVQPATTTTSTSTSTTTTTTANPPLTTTSSVSLTEQLRPHRTYVLYIWLSANVPMSIMQLYFLSLIFYEIQQKFV